MYDNCEWILQIVVSDLTVNEHWVHPVNESPSSTTSLFVILKLNQQLDFLNMAKQDKISF